MMVYQIIGLALFGFNVSVLIISAVGYSLLRLETMMKIRFDITNAITWIGLLGRSVLLMLYTLEIPSICLIDHVARIIIVNPLIGPTIQAYKLFHRYRYHRRLSSGCYTSTEDRKEALTVLNWILGWKHSLICYLALHVIQLLLNMVSFIYTIVMKTEDCSPWLNLTSDALYICLLLFASILIIWNLRNLEDLNWIKKEYIMLGITETVGIAAVIMISLFMDDIGIVLLHAYFMVIGIIIFTIPSLLSFQKKLTIKTVILTDDTMIDIQFETEPSLNRLLKTSLANSSIDAYMSIVFNDNPVANFSLQFLKDFTLYDKQKKSIARIGRAHLIYQRFFKDGAYLHLNFLDQVKLQKTRSIIEKLHAAVEKVPDHTDPKVDCSELNSAMNELRKDVEKYVIENVINPFLNSDYYRKMITRIGTAQEVLDIEFIVSSDE